MGYKDDDKSVKGKRTLETTSISNGLVHTYVCVCIKEW